MGYPMMLYLNDKPFHTVNSEEEHRQWAPQDFKPEPHRHRGPPPAGASAGPAVKKPRASRARVEPPV